MPKITITEKDLTKTSLVEDVSNVVYIPGFSTATVNLNAADDDYTLSTSTPNGVPVGTPKLCTSLTEFTYYFGSSIPTFDANQSYPAFDDGTGTSSSASNGFNSTALSGLSNMFSEGEYDPSYVMAYELIKAGIPVLYERVNYFDSTVIANRLSSGEELPTKQTDDYAPTIGYLYLNTADSLVYIVTDVDSDGGLTWAQYCDDTFSSTDDIASDVTVEAMYAFLETAFASTRDGNDVENILIDKNTYDIKYLTAGGYPVFEYDTTSTTNSIANDMIALAETYRQDCIAIIDHVNNPNRSLTGGDSVFYAVNNDYTMPTTYGAMFTPWYLSSSTFGSRYMSAGFGYLVSLAETIKTSPNWLAIAGVTRGVIPNAKRLNTNQKLTNSIADYMTDSLDNGGICINPITNIRNYGLTIWGNRTLASTETNTESALYYLNMRSLLCEIKKGCFVASQTLMFEQNSDILWTNFKAKITPILDRMKSGAGIRGYKIIKLTTSSNTEIKAQIKVYPIYAVETFTISVILSNEDVEVEEE